MSDKIGRCAHITQLVHSHARVRAYAPALIGRSGVIVAVLRNGSVALLELDMPEYPAGVRRWPIAWGDLEIAEVVEQPRRRRRFPAGFTEDEDGRVQHAVLTPDGHAHCGRQTLRLKVLEFSIPFAPNLPSTCGACKELVSNLKDSPEELL